MYLNNYRTDGYTPGASIIKQFFLFFLGDFLFRTRSLPIAAFKVFYYESLEQKSVKELILNPMLKLNFLGD